MSDRISQVLTGWRPLARPPVSGSMILRILDQIMLWQERTRSRQQLAALDERMLQDIGIDRAAADREASQAFWRGRRFD